MNKICLNKLCEFSVTSYISNINNINFNNKFNFEEVLNGIKQNLSLNENGLLINFNFTEFNNLIKNIEQNELLLLCPITFNIYENKEWYNFLNALLVVLHDKYIYENKIQKKVILENTNKIYKNKINMNSLNNIIENVAKLTNISIIIVSENEKRIFNSGRDKYIILFKYNDEYYPFINWNIKYFEKENNFVNYLENNLKFEGKEINNFKKYKIDSDNGENINKNYQEFSTNEDFALHVSEAVDNNNLKLSKKKNKKKDIFVVNNDNENDKNNDNNSTFIKTEKLTKKDITEIKENLKSTILVNELQKIALKLSINIFSGSTKTGKPKSKTKKELFDEIKNKLEKL